MASLLLSFTACHAIQPSIFASVPWVLCCPYQYNQFIRHYSVYSSKTCTLFPEFGLQPYKTTFSFSVRLRQTASRLERASASSRRRIDNTRQQQLSIVPIGSYRVLSVGSLFLATVATISSRSRPLIEASGAQPSHQARWVIQFSRLLLRILLRLLV